jgi:aspartate/methionine/tyrosine aminotransferase
MINPVDVSFGHPLYMQQYWEFLQKMNSTKAYIKITDGLAYNYGTPRPELIESIKSLHNYVGNAVTKGYEIVVGAGASQVISALAYATVKAGFHEILLQPPYWGKLERLLNAGGHAAGMNGRLTREKREHIYSPDDEWLTFTTNPNNPDGSISEIDTRFSVVDMCYNWPQYTKKVVRGNYDVMIFGLSKSTGHAGTRIGWALVKSPEIAEYMREYVHSSTCGVSEDAQIRATHVIGCVLSAKDLEVPDCFEFGKNKLRERWTAFRIAANSAKVNFKILNSSGMFAWCEHELEGMHNYNFKQLKMNRFKKTVEEVYVTCDTNWLMQKTYDIKVTPGCELGLDSTTRCFRINLGCSDENFATLLERLKHGNKTKESGT